MHVRRAAVILCCLLLVGLAACSGNRNRTHIKNNVEKALTQAGFEHDVTVAFDQAKGVVALTGRVRSDELKTKAGQVAQDAAPGSVVSNQLSIEPVDQEQKARQIESNVDDAIEKNYKAVLIANHLDNQRIHYTAKNGVLTLEGKVKTTDDRAEAEKLGATVPNVTQVVNKLNIGK